MYCEILKSNLLHKSKDCAYGPVRSLSIKWISIELGGHAHGILTIS